MQVIIDGKEVNVLESVKIIADVSGSGLAGITEDATLELTFNQDGMVADLWEITAESKEELITFSEWDFYEDLVTNKLFQK